jgi:SAM-dependent methyltransferase
MMIRMPKNKASQANNSRETSQRVISSSFRDPSGFLFREEGVLYRQVNQVYKQDYDRLIDSGLNAELVRRNLLIPCEEVKGISPHSELAYRVIRPELIEYVSYPYEWCFSQYKDAALATLRIQKYALEYGMSLKDASAYNIQFHQGHPVLIDSLSFEIYQPDQPWVAYRQFCQHFLAPLALMSYVDIRLGQLMRVYIDGIPLDLAVSLLPFTGRFKIPLLLHLYLHAGSQRRYRDRPAAPVGKMTKNALLGLIDNLESGINSLRYSSKDSEWGNYYEVHNYSQAGIAFKEKLIAAYLERIQPHIAWDLGANTGRFSRIASKMNIQTIAFDIDPAAVETNYRQSKLEHVTNLLPLVADLTNPSPGIGWQNQERLSFLERGPADVVIALALIHHLAISNNVPLERIADFLRRAGRWLIVEFVPKTDSQVQRLLSTRKDIFPDYHQQGFENAFQKSFTLHDVQMVPDAERSIYLMETK